MVNLTPNCSNYKSSLTGSDSYMPCAGFCVQLLWVGTVKSSVIGCLRKAYLHDYNLGRYCGSIVVLLWLYCGAIVALLWCYCGDGCGEVLTSVAGH